MKALLTADDLYAHILFLRASDKRTILLVESDADCSALDPHIDLEKCETIPGNGKGTVLGAMGIVKSTGPLRVLGVVDSDIDEYLGHPVDAPNVVTTDFYDMEATIFFSPGVAHRLASAHMDREALRGHLAAAGCDVSELVARITYPLGVVRYLTRRDSLGLNLRDFPLGEVIRSDGLDIDLTALVRLVLLRSKTASLSEGELATSLESELAARPLTLAFCSGHDLAATFSGICRRFCGGNTGVAQMHKALRGTWDCASLAGTNLYRDVQAWATANSTTVWNCRASYG